MPRVQGVVLAGERGRNLYPLTDRVHKHLLPVANKPLIAYALETLLRFHVSEILVVLSPASRAEVEGYIRRCFQADKDRRSRISYFSSEEATNSVQALAQLHARGLITRDTLVISGDLLTDCNLHELIDCHVQGGNDITLAVHDHPESQLLLFKDSDSGHVLKMGMVEELKSRGARFSAVFQRMHPRTAITGQQELCQAFVLRPRVFALIEHLAARFHSFFREMLPFLVEHQFSAKLLRHSGEAEQRLVVREFCVRGLSRRVRTLQDFLQLNIEAVRCLAKPGVLGASANNTGLSGSPPALRQSTGGSFFSEGCVVASPEHVVSSFLQENCHLGPGTKCINSLVMRSAVIAENCVVRNSIIGAGVNIAAGSVIVDSTLGDHLSLRENSSLDSETLAKSHASEGFGEGRELRADLNAGPGQN